MNTGIIYKAVGAFFIAIVVALLAGVIAKYSTAPRVLEEDAYPIDVIDVVSTPQAADGTTASAKAVKKKKVAAPILAMLADADIARGQKLSKACTACHKFDQGGANGVGPNLYGIVGRQKQSVSGFKYSGTLNAQGGNVWTYTELNKFLWKPKKYAAGTKMSYAGLKKPKDRAALIGWLRTLSGSAKALPSAAAIAADSAE